MPSRLVPASCSDQAGRSRITLLHQQRELARPRCRARSAARLVASGSARRRRTVGGGRDPRPSCRPRRLAAGSTMLKVEPLPGVLRTRSAAPIACASSRRSPCPGRCRARRWSRRRGAEVLEQPRLLLRRQAGASSRTAMRRWPSTGSIRDVRQRAAMLYLIALDSRFISILLSARRSARTQCVHGGGRHAGLFDQRRDEGPGSATAPRAGLHRLEARRRRAGARCARGRARRRSARAGASRPARPLSSWRCWSAPVAPRRSSAISCAKPRMPFSGVRSSWAHARENLLWRGLARSASSFVPGAAVCLGLLGDVAAGGEHAGGAPSASTSVCRRFPACAGCRRAAHARARSAARAWRSPAATAGLRLRSRSSGDDGRGFSRPA